MEPCDDRWREPLLDYVLGLSASTALTEHLGNCAVCSEVFREWRARSGQIADGIQKLAASEPSSQAATRVMAEVRAQGERRGSPAWKWAAAMLSALAIVAASFVYFWKAHEHRRQEESALLAAEAIGRWKSPTQELLRSPNDRWLETPPRLGQYFYRLDLHVPEKESENP